MQANNAIGSQKPSRALAAKTREQDRAKAVIILTGADHAD